MKNRLSKLIQISDTKIESIFSKELKREDFKLPDELPKEIVDEFYERNKIRTYSYHKLYDGIKEVGVEEFDLSTINGAVYNTWYSVTIASIKSLSPRIRAFQSP